MHLEACICITCSLRGSLVYISLKGNLIVLAFKASLGDYEGIFMQEKKVNSVMTEESVVSKVKELMETLDHIKKYNTLSSSLKKFSLIVIGSIVVSLVVSISLSILGIDYTPRSTQSFFYGFMLSLIPLIGIVLGVFYVRRQVNATKTGEWKEKLSGGFPSALEILIELDWNKTLDEISRGKFSYTIYGLLKTAAYWLVTFFGLQLVGNGLTIYFLQQAVFFKNFVSVAIALILVLLLLGRDLFRRYKEIHALDMLFLELRWFSFELRRAEF